MKITILGAGAWGTALARLLDEGHHALTLWSNLPDHLAEMQAIGRNDRFFPGFSLSKDWRFEADQERAVAGCDALVVAVPSKAVRSVAQSLGAFSGTVISVTKGIEYETGLSMSGILEASMPLARVAALSGPSLAFEVARGIPTAIVSASRQIETARAVQELFHRPTFRVYTSTDILGVELGGALKNVIAIAAGVGDGLGFGDNSKAALVTRAIVEMRRLGMACGAQPETFSGLSGLGDLTVTCYSRLSRNRGLGERLGRGERLADILSNLVAVAEGYPTAQAAYRLAQRLQVATPIINEVYAMLYENKDVAQALRDLLNRDSKSEGL
jgi:glycerol-3-phosphate dehydrogenase (NAD(P)+)